MQFSRYILAAVVGITAFATSACSDAFQPIPWSDTPVEETLYSASREAYAGRTSAFDLVSTPPRTVAIESESASGGWDVVLIDSGSGLALESGVTFEGVKSSARIATITNTGFADVKTAPKDTTAYSAGPVVLSLGKVYIVRSRSTSCTLTSGPLYAKLEPTEIDNANGIFRFKYVENPNCGDRSFVAPAE